MKMTEGPYASLEKEQLVFNDTLNRLMNDTNVISEIARLLNLGDNLNKNVACDKGIKRIGECEDREEMEYISNLIVLHLLDLLRFADANRCVKIMIESKETVIQWNGYYALIESCKRQSDRTNFERAIEEAKSFAENKGNEQMFIYLYKEEGVAFIREEKFDDAIKTFAEMEFLSDKCHRYDQVAISRYYTAICLNQLGMRNMANDKLREVTEMAQNIGNKTIAQNSEMTRAYFLMEKGKFDDVKEILQDCVTNFSLLL